MIKSKLQGCCLKLSHALRCGVLLSLSSVLVGCADVDIPALTIDSVSFYTELDANQNSAVPVDLVLVYDTEVNKMISSLSSSKYFENSRQLQRDNPAALDVWHWELVPGQSVVDFEIDQSKGDAFDGYVFANYLNPGDHRIKVPPSGKVKILFQKTELKDLATLNVQNVVQGVSSPQPLNAPTEASQSMQSAKSHKISRSTSDFQDFDTRIKGTEPDMTPPYIFQIPGHLNTGDTGPIDLRPEDSKKGMGDTNLLSPGGAASSPVSAPQATKPCPSRVSSFLHPQQSHQASGVSSSVSSNTQHATLGSIYDHMPYHGPMTTTHSHVHPHMLSGEGHESGSYYVHTHDHGHPHPLISADSQPISSTVLAPPHGVSQ